MKEIATIQFTDAQTGDNALATVRASAEAIGLGLSLRSNGDVEVFLLREDCEKLITALQRAVLMR